MATREYGIVVGRQAAVDLSTKLYRVVKLHSVTGQVTSMSAASDKPYGILLNTPSANQNASVQLICGGGTAKVSAEATIALGAYVMSSADGQAQSATPYAGTGTSRIFGVCEEAATSAANVVTIMLNPPVAAGIA